MPLMLLLFLVVFACHDPALAGTFDNPDHVAFLRSLFWAYRRLERPVSNF